MIEPKRLLDFIKERRSIRTFQDKMVSDEHIDLILEAARWTPSASNRQAWEFIIIKNKEMIRNVARCGISAKFILRRAPVLIAIVGKRKIQENWYVVDTSLASMNMMLMAWSLGIGSCWIGSFDFAKGMDVLSLDKEEDYLLTVLPLGYIKGEIPKPTLRKPLDEIKKVIE